MCKHRFGGQLLQNHCYVAAPYFHLCLIFKDTIKGAKRENFLLAFFTLREPIWVGDLGTEPKNPFCFNLTPDLDCFCLFGFLPHTECSVNK
jgi:hypothetical protein